MRDNDIQSRLDAGENIIIDDPAVVMITGSEGRRGIVKAAGLDWVLLYNNFDEEAVKSRAGRVDTVKKAAAYAERLSMAKCENVRGRFINAAVITADTVVFNRGLLEKPRDEAEVYRMIRGLNGTPHSVITGVTVSEGRAGKPPGVFSFSEVSQVLLTGVDDKIIAEMIRTENPYACSGGYTIDGMLNPYFKVLSGSVENVIGLPLREILLRL